jgi:mRNA-degrading endonuclease toxin of MazEF toxin-antitoxin module
LLLSRDDAYSQLNKFTAAEIKTVIRGIPVDVNLGPRDGMPEPCVVNCDKLHTVSLTKRISRLQTALIDK